MGRDLRFRFLFLVSAVSTHETDWLNLERAAGIDISLLRNPNPGDRSPTSQRRRRGAKANGNLVVGVRPSRPRWRSASSFLLAELLPNAALT